MLTMLILGALRIQLLVQSVAAQTDAGAKVAATTL